MWTVIAIATGWLAVGLLVTIPFGAIAYGMSKDRPGKSAPCQKIDAVEELAA